MSFYSSFAERIWEDLYTVLIPDQVTLNPDYVRVFGIRSTGNREVDRVMANSLTEVKIPIIKILEYHESGVQVQIPSRADMITMHKNLEGYLAEWRNHLRMAINTDVNKHKQLIMGLEKLSKIIYEKAHPREVIDNLFVQKKFGLMNPMQQRHEESKEVSKPDYQGIAQLIKPHVQRGRF